jgi:hypothetical protein
VVLEDLAVVVERPVGDEPELRSRLVRPEADEDDEDEWRDEEEAEPHCAWECPEGGPPPSALLAALAERGFGRLLDLLCFFDLLDVEAGRMLRS